ncbi:PrsW family intramembrane metalloprotease [Lentilactobacillus kefiri]|uniref:Protease PrsW n=1 Tax=Lentilactobacillus kefiri TaxID=33962 RepID=A0A511DX83_LENKE|nr:PrsW family glutamic-type intramembrane protease [Lentilactobacillus kefiri]MCJ2161881.1 PrsW family glutamic-type intramembrane protease [Lentilactobacillus kefiri]MCP9370227.1 PrsW family intramembrane metalloprotease [Lentilactobacillus kefiri]MDH5108599.1 PrsW family glutamic-type intramembrane protease [Lentilactobacillus kefiri]MDM7492582.1 PrsW family glutamic-type intramembrane protease [Lentilactobacillus kefiri]PAK58457.1 PrsW family intramembrane metalloprotease [Lentilactobacill
MKNRIKNIGTKLFSLVWTGVRRNYDNLDDNIAKHLGETDPDSPVEIHLSRIFSQVFKRHTSEEADRLFIVGTRKTTPSLRKVSSRPVTPWFFTRVFLLLAISFVMLMSLLFIFKSNKVIPGIIFIGSLAVPFSLLMMFFEINVYQNISVRQAMIIFLVGGILSLIVTMTFYMILPIRTEISIESAFIVGLVEELAKCVVIILFINAYKANYIFNGVLIGAAIGAGFSVFESSGYVSEYGLVTIFTRSFQAIGTHTIWAAIIGGAVILGKQRKKHFTMKDFFTKPKFFVFFLIAICLHTFWDWDIPNTGIGVSLVQEFIDIVIGWFLIFIMIDAGLREVKTLQGQQILIHRSKQKKLVNKR